MDLKTQDYEDAASSTIPPIVHTEAVRAAVVFHLLTEFAKAGTNLDKYLKKPLVYGPTRVTEEHVAQFVGLADIDPPRSLTPEEAMFAHGVVGVATEAGELVEALLKVWFFKEPWDRPNVLEEGGDVLWYVVRFLKAAGYTLPEAMERNILKLTNRHHRNGATFNPDADRNRDLEAERALLEAPAPVRAIVEGAAARPPQEPYLGLATNAQLRAEMEARESLGHTADDYRTTDGGATAERRGLALLVTRGDQGQEEVWLDSYAGGAAPGGEWATLTTALYLGPNPDEEAIRRTYIACDLLAPDGVTIKCGDLSVSATGVHADKLLERQDLGEGMVLERRSVDRPATAEEAASLYPERSYPVHGTE